MNYRQIGKEKTSVFYRVTDHEAKAAEFSYHMEEEKSTDRDGVSRFWLEEVKLFGTFANYECMYAVLQFISYKSWSTGTDAIYLKISGKNLFYLELYKRFGFFVIAEETREIHEGVKTYEYVMKYPLPQTREEEYFHYIRGK